MWPRGKRRMSINPEVWIVSCLQTRTIKELATSLKVSDRTVRRWRDGVNWMSLSHAIQLTEILVGKDIGSLPLYSPSMAIDGNTRVLGVGDYSRRSARGVM